MARLRLAGIALLSLSACSTTPEVPALAAQGLPHQLLPGTGFTHLAYAAPGVPAGVLHIYLEGDGRPWRNRYTVNTDPTPHTPLMPALMAQDSAPKLFLGRPCYHGLAATPGCAPQHWTQGRYGEPVVASLAAALQTYLVQQPQVQRLVFIGHSGGGTLALLLAARFPQTLAVITLAANFDHAAWTAQAGYTPLSTSLYPLELPPLPVVQWHYAGASDTQVPPAISAAITRTQPQAHFSLYPQADHTCCWAAATTWREILAPLQALEATTGF